VSRHVVFTAWTGPERLALGKHDGTTATTGELTVDHATGAREYADPHRDGAVSRYERATWTSPEVSTGFPAGDLIVSWNATTPLGSWLEVEVSAALSDGTRTPWYVLARWAESDEDILPTSVTGQDDDLAEVQADVLRVRPPRGVVSYRVRLHLMRRPGAASPSVRLVGAMASESPDGQTVQRSPGGGAEGRLLDVPAYSQQLHRGEYPHWDSGGASWCSPTSTTMVLAYWGRLPDPAEYAWVDPRFRDRYVDHAARHTYDYSYQGAGNWPFNTAYAARYGLTAFVTRLRSLTEAEQFIKAGIPLVVGVSFTEDELSGAGYGTGGHLLTIVGFTEQGDVVSNDPASHGVPDNAQVRTTYDREQFENAWMGMSGGVTYVIHPPEVALPPRPQEPNW
jgi:hypothetical protein